MQTDAQCAFSCILAPKCRTPAHSMWILRVQSPESPRSAVLGVMHRKKDSFPGLDGVWQLYAGLNEHSYLVLIYVGLSHPLNFTLRQRFEIQSK